MAMKQSILNIIRAKWAIGFIQHEGLSARKAAEKAKLVFPHFMRTIRRKGNEDLLRNYNAAMLKRSNLKYGLEVSGDIVDKIIGKTRMTRMG